MTGNPLSGHTKANESTMVGSGVFTDGLTDGEHIQSPTLTNYLEGIHGNGILLEEDTALGATARNTPEDLPGVCEQITNSYTIRVTGGTAIIDGVLYNFAGGVGNTQDIELTSTSAHRRATYSALTSGQEALVVVYISTKTTTQCVQWELGTPITTATNTYPTTPSAFLIDPDTLTTLTSKQSVVLAVLRVVYSATGGDLNISVSESNDKRVFLKPSPMYLTPVTSGIVGNDTAIDSHTALDGIISGSTGSLTGSRMGALWQSYNADGDAVLYYSSKDSGGTRHTHVLGPVGYVTSSPSSTTTFTFNEGQVFVLNPSSAIQFNPSGTFPLGHLVYVTNEAAHGTNGITFDNSGIGTVILGKESGVFVYTGSAWKNVMYASGATSPNGHGASGNVQLSDGGGGFTSDNDLNWNSGSNELTVNGKLTVTGLIDPTGLVIDEKADVAATGHTTVASKGLIWIKDDAPNNLYFTDDAGNDVPITNNGALDVATAGAITDSDFSTNGIMKRTGAGTYATAVADTDYQDVLAEGAFVDGDKTKLDGIASGATAYADADAIAAVEGEATLDLTGDVTIANKKFTVDTNTLVVNAPSYLNKVGIGTATPDSELHIVGSANPTLRISETGQNGYTTYSSVVDSQAKIEAVNDTASEGVILDINPKCNASTGTSQEVRIFRESRSGIDGNFRVKQVGTNTDVFNVYSDKDGTNHMMTMDGKVGIGNTSPDAPLHVETSGTGDAVIIESTDTGGGGLAPDLVLKRNTSVASEELGNIRFLGLDSGAAEQEYADLYAGINTNTAGNESGEIFLRTIHDGTLRRRIDITKNEVVINEDSVDSNFRVESDGETHMLFVDAGNDRVGIGTNDPQGPLHVKHSGTSYVALFETDDDGASAAPDVALFRNGLTPANGDDIGHLIWRGTTDDGDSTVTRTNITDIFSELQVATTGAESGKMHLRTKKAGTMNKRISIEATKTIINQDNVDADFIVEGVGNANLIFADSSADKVGIGHAASTIDATLDILTGGTFRNTRLLTVSVSASTTLTEADHAGRYNICAGNITLPATSTAGEHYAILNTTGGDITIGRNGNNINGAASDFTLGTYNAATCIAIGSNNWMVVG